MKVSEKVKEVSVFKDHEAVSAIVSIYQKSFGLDPWNEGYKCPICQTVFSLNIKGIICTRCLHDNGQSILLIKYWPEDRIVSDLYKEMSKPNAMCLTLERVGEIVAFAWGYSVTVCKDINIHLESVDIERNIDGDFFYLDECAVLPDLQGQGIGRKVIQSIVNRHNPVRIILRTLNNSPMFKLIKNLQGEVVQYISRDRVIMKISK